MKLKIIRWFRHLKDIVFDIISWTGIYWLFIEMISYQTSGSVDSFFKNFTLTITVFAIICVISLIKNRPRSSFRYSLRGKDNFIEIKVCDALKIKGALIVPVNDEFDMALGGHVFKTKSIQNQIIQQFYAGKVEHLNTDISTKVDIGTKYEVGKTIEIDQSGKTFYLVVNSIKQENGRVKSEIDHFIQALNGLWQYMALESGRNSSVTIPVMNTQHGRDSNLTRRTAIKEIITSFVEASKNLNVCESLIIAIHPTDLLKGNLDLDELDDFLRLTCKHYRKLTLQQRDQDPDNGSKIIAIDN
jgi:hypothetical protein